MSDLTELNAGAIVKAVAVAFMACLAIGAMVGFMGFWLLFSGVLTAEAVESSLLLHGFIFCLALLPDVIGGYLAAIFAGRNELLHGVVTGIALLAISGLFYLFPDDDPFTLLDGIALFLTIPLAVSGAAIAKRLQ